MIRYIIRRVLAMIPKLLLITMIVFAGLQLLPGDPIVRTFPPELLAGLSEAQIEVLRDQAGLSDPLPLQYAKWIGRILQGDLGYSVTSGSDISH